jgi:hypothetical protein
VSATSHRTHRQLLELEHHLDVLQQEIFDVDRWIDWDALPASGQVASFRMGLRLSDLDVMLARKWASPAVRAAALRAARGIHEAFIGPIPNEKNELTVFTVSRSSWTLDLVGYIEAFRLERDGHWCTPNGSTYGVTMTAVEGPIWVHDLYRHLIGVGNEGERLRAHYRYDSAPKRGQRGDVIGRAVTRPTDEELEAALTLWAPDSTGPFQDLADAIDAARLL